jgi:hypothetical protein
MHPEIPERAVKANPYQYTEWGKTS